MSYSPNLPLLFQMFMATNFLSPSMHLPLSHVVNSWFHLPLSLILSFLFVSFQKTQKTFDPLSLCCEVPLASSCCEHVDLLDSPWQWRSCGNGNPMLWTTMMAIWCYELSKLKPFYLLSLLLLSMPLLMLLVLFHFSTWSSLRA